MTSSYLVLLCTAWASFGLFKLADVLERYTADERLSRIAEAVAESRR